MTSKPPLPDDLLADIDRLAPQLTLLDHYGVLGVQETSSDVEIKQAYLRVIQRFHPDRWHARDSSVHRKRMEAIFARATEAYEVLRHPAQKLEYDRSLYEIRGIPRPSAMPKKPAPPIAPPAIPAVAREGRRPPSATELAQAARLLGQLRPPTAAPAARGATPPPKPSAPTPAPATPSAPRLPIVVVEDDDALRKMLVRILGELYDVREARDGKEALEVVMREPIPRLVVTDVMMPNMDGLELARRLKAEPKTKSIPIVMLTAKQGSRDVIDGVNAGARIYVTKPFKVDDLKAKVKKAMGL
jgi:CheY-like chemotaxis protein